MKNPIQTCLLILLLPLSLPTHAQELGNPECEQLLLVSGWRNNNVKIFDACDGSFIRDLDEAGLLRGPQAIALDPQGRVVVASENNGRLVRYHRETLLFDRVLAGDQPDTPELEIPPVPSPTGLVISADGSLLVGSFTQNRVTQVDPLSGEAVVDVIAAGSSGLSGPDTGMLLEGNRLWVPAFESSTVVGVDISQPGSDFLAVPPGTGGLNAPRTVVRAPSGNLLLTSWRGNQILEFDEGTGGLVRVVSNSVTRPTGMALESDEFLLVASDSTNDISRVRISDGQRVGTAVDAGAGGLDGPTFVLALDKQSPKSPRLAENNAFWTIGLGEIQDRTIHSDSMIFTTGGGFGALLNPQQMEEIPWGSLEIAFDGCHSGRMDYDSVEPGFGSGGYNIFRLAPGPTGSICDAAGFENVEGSLWMAGVWFGGADRSGEGFTINVIDGELAIVAWYTYMP